MSAPSCGANKVTGSCRLGAGWCREVQAGGLSSECLPKSHVPKTGEKAAQAAAAPAFAVSQSGAECLRLTRRLASAISKRALCADCEPLSSLGVCEWEGGRLHFPKMSLQSVADAYRCAETGGLGKECTHISAPVRRRWRAETETGPPWESSQGPGPTPRLCGSPRPRGPCVALAPAGQPVSSTCCRSRRSRAPRWR